MMGTMIMWRIVHTGFPRSPPQTSSHRFGGDKDDSDGDNDDGDEDEDDEDT